jgi:CheY-like chemotaxis protein
LLVEDDPDIRTVVAVMMQLWGETALALPDGNAAWKWLDSVDGGAASDLPELALMDIRMPGHTGDQIAARIRQTEKIKNIPIILMTAFSLTDAEVTTMKEKVGIDHLIKKPLPDMDDFKNTLYRVRDEKRKTVAAVPTPPAPTPAPALPSVSEAAPPAPTPPPTPPSATPLPPNPPATTAPTTAPAAPPNPAPATSPVVPPVQSAPITSVPTPTPAPVVPPVQTVPASTPAPTPTPAPAVPPNRDTKPLG